MQNGLTFVKRQSKLRVNYGMKKILGVAFVLTFAIIATSNSQLFSRNFLKPTDAIDLNSNSPQKVLGLDEEKQIKIEWFVVEDIDNLKLIPNFSEKLGSKEIKNKYNCKNLVSGGFYTQDNRPIGLFIVDNTKVRDYVKASLTNAILSVNDFATPRITSTLPKDNLPIALQNGPMLFDNGAKLNLNIQNDKPARRMVAAVTGENKLVFITLYSSGSAFDGPYLEELPSILEEFEKRSHMQIADAMNLDGGTASTFMNGNVNLSEASFVGSFFCEM